MRLIDTLYLPKGINQYKYFKLEFDEYFKKFVSDIAKCVTELSLYDDDNYFNPKKEYRLSFIVQNYFSNTNMNEQFKKYVIDDSSLLAQSLIPFFENIKMPIREYLNTCSEKSLKMFGLLKEDLVYIEKIANMNLDEKDKTNAISMYCNKIIIPKRKEHNEKYKKDEYKKYLEEVKYIFEGGRRFRPALVLFGYGYGNKPVNQELLNVSSIIEFMHKYSLIVDDLYDDDNYRRGILTFKKKYGASETKKMIAYLIIIYNNLVNNTSKLTDDKLINYSVNQYEQSHDLVAMIRDTWVTSHEGFFEEVESRKSKKNLTVEECIDIELKQSATILKNALKIGYTMGVSEANEEVLSLLNQLGEKIGLTFQILNDVEVFLNEGYQKGNKGKLYSDLECGAKNFVVSQIPQDVVQYMSKDDKIVYIKENKLIEQTICFVEEEFKKVFDILKKLPNSGTMSLVSLFMTIEYAKLGRLSSQKKYSHSDDLITLNLK